MSIFSQTLDQIQARQVLNIILAKSSEKEGGKNIALCMYMIVFVQSKGGLCNSPLIHMSLVLFDPRK